jgi:hypothetical protein
MDDEQSTYIRVRSASANIFFNPCKSIDSFQLTNQFHFYLKYDFRVIYENLGMDTESPIWEYFALNLKNNGSPLNNRYINLSFQVDLPTNKAEEIIKNFQNINMSVNFENSLDLTRKMAFYDKVKHFYLPKYLYINLDDHRTLIKNVGFDFESPYIIEFSKFDLFSNVITNIQKTICDDPDKCRRVQDLKHHFDKKAKLTLNFSYYNPLDNNVNNFKVEFIMEELFYYQEDDPEQLLKFNIKYRSKDDYTSHKNIENYLGLLFLQKVKLIMSYKDSTQNFSLVLMDKNGINKLSNFMYLWIFLISLIFSILLLCKVDLDVKGKSRINYQTFLTNN